MTGLVMRGPLAVVLALVWWLAVEVCTTSAARVRRRLLYWLRLRACYWLSCHRWTPWEQRGWSRGYIGKVRVFDGHVYSRRCTVCGKYETKDA